MRVALAVCLLIGISLGYLAWSAQRGRPGPHAHEEMGERVWVDEHRRLAHCQHCGMTRVYFDGAMVRNWGTWASEDVHTAVVTTRGASTATAE